MVAEIDPQAAALGYKANATSVDKARYPKYAAGGFSLFGAKQVAGEGWCSVYTKND
jgi:hypothetical protein